MQTLPPPLQNQALQPADEATMSTHSHASHRLDKTGFRLKWRAKLAPYPAPIRAAGFTLIELSIVLVIIGLLVGGVLVGNDLIESAKIRGTIAQTDKYKAAYQTFRLKYNCIPGDCKTASSFGLTGLYSGTNYTNGDGDKLIYSYNDGTNNNATNYGTTPKYGETWSALAHLGDAGLIERAYRNGLAAGTSNISLNNSFMIFTSLRPITPQSGFIMPNKAGNYLYVGFEYPAGTGASFNVLRPTFSPLQAYRIDEKIDDGLPMSGSVRPTYTSYSCTNIIVTAQGPCFNIPLKKSGGWPDWSATILYTVDDTTSPPTYHTTPFNTPTGYEHFAKTSITITVD